MQRDLGMVDESPWKNSLKQVHIETTHHGAGIVHIKFQAGTTGEINHYTRDSASSSGT